jgi:hypothetical protein
MVGIFTSEIDELCARLQALKAPRESATVPGYFYKPDGYNGLLQDTEIDADCPETMELMRRLLMDAAKAIDPFFAKFAAEAHVGNPGEYAHVATYAVEGFLEWELQNKADEIREQQPSEPYWPNGHFASHRL